MNDSLGKTFASFLPGRLRMLVAPAARRRSPRPHSGDGPRQARAAATIGCAKHLGFGTIRDGLRWHLIEKSPGKYDWSSWLPALEAAERIGVQIIWDLFHYGSPDHVDQAGEDFPERFTDFALAALEVQQSVSGRSPLVCPLNEINFLSWAVDDGYFPRVGPDERGLVQAPARPDRDQGGKSDQQRWPDATIVWAEPLIHIAPHDRRRATVRAAEQNLQGMFEAYDWIMGLAEPELGGDPSLVDVVGWNFYPHNQWYYEGPTIPMGHHEYRPLADMLVEMAERYSKPIFLSETGAEGSAKPSWLHYVCNEVRDAMDRGADIRGICWYPITAYPGWDNSASRRDRTAFDDRGGRQPPRRRAAARGVRGAARAVRLRRPRQRGGARTRNRRGLELVGRSADKRPAVAPFDAVDQQDPAAVDLVLLPLTRAVHVDRMIDRSTPAPALSVTMELCPGASQRSLLNSIRLCGTPRASSSVSNGPVGSRERATITPYSASGPQQLSPE